jgi:hypothetical protein
MAMVGGLKTSPGEATKGNSSEIHGEILVS